MFVELIETGFHSNTTTSLRFDRKTYFSENRFHLKAQLNMPCLSVLQVKLKEFFVKLKEFSAKLKVLENPFTCIAAKWLKKQAFCTQKSKKLKFMGEVIGTNLYPGLPILTNFLMSTLAFSGAG